MLVLSQVLRQQAAPAVLRQLALLPASEAGSVCSLLRAAAVSLLLWAATLGAGTAAAMAPAEVRQGRWPLLPLLPLLAGELELEWPLPLAVPVWLLVR